MAPNLNPLAGTLQRAAAAGQVDHEIGKRRAWSPDSDLYTYISDRGFHFPPELVTRYLLSLVAKPFVIFTGISGTGKTKLALLTAEYFAHKPGMPAMTTARPVDTDTTFHLRIDRTTLKSGALVPLPEQFEYFHVSPGETEVVNVNITNVLGAQGDLSVRVTNLVHGGRKHITLGIPAGVRRSFEELGVQEGDYLTFQIVEEYRRFSVSLMRPERTALQVPATDRYAFVNVRPSWVDHTALLGEWDDNLGQYLRTPVLELLIRAEREERAAREEERSPSPYFIVLDEMNIARIEHYFSDFLSAMESRRYDADGETITQEALALHNAPVESTRWIDETGFTWEVPQRLAIPTNVLFTGTVNDDDTTFGISPKVLDRANTLEFSAVDFSGFLGVGTAAQEREEALVLPADRLATLHIGALELPSQTEAQELRDQLAPLLELNTLLAPMNRHFGYRVLNEVAHFLHSARDMVGAGQAVLDAALDAQILQKVLPKVANLDDDREGFLTQMLVLLTTGAIPPSRPPGSRWAFPDVESCFVLDPPDIANVDRPRLDAAIVAGAARPALQDVAAVQRPMVAAVASGQDGAGGSLDQALYPRSAAWLVTLLSRMSSRA